DADDERDARVHRLVDRVLREGGGNVDHGAIRSGLLHRVLDRIEDRNPVDLLASLPRRHARDHLGAVVEHAARVEGAVPSRDALHDDAGRASDENAHAASAARAITARTASSMSLSAGRPRWPRSSRPSFSLVPVSRITIGMRTLRRSSAARSPRATSSHRVMPPKMLKSTARTRPSRVRMLIAASTFSGLLEPPMSRKFAGFPPWNWIRSMVAMARPAPFTTHPMEPSSFT